MLNIGCFYFSIRMYIVVAQSLSIAQLFPTPWNVACQASLPLIAQSLLNITTIESVMLFNHLIRMYRYIHMFMYHLMIFVMVCKKLTVVAVFGKKDWKSQWKITLYSFVTIVRFISIIIFNFKHCLRNTLEY